MGSTWTRKACACPAPSPCERTLWRNSAALQAHCSPTCRQRRPRRQRPRPRAVVQQLQLPRRRWLPRVLSLTRATPHRRRQSTSPPRGTVRVRRRGPQSNAAGRHRPSGRAEPSLEHPCTRSGPGLSRSGCIRLVRAAYARRPDVERGKRDERAGRAHFGRHLSLRLRVPAAERFGKGDWVH